MIAAWTRQHTKHEAMEIIGAAGIPAGAVLDTMELSNDPTFEQRGIMQTIDHPGRQVQDGRLAGALLRQPAAGEAGTVAWRRTTRTC